MYDAFDLPLAERGTRLGASIVDSLALAACVVPFLLVTAWVSPRSALLPVVAGVLAFLAFVGYQTYLLTTQGQTIGKRLLDIRVVMHDTGALPGFGRAVGLRVVVPSVIGAIPGLGGLFGLVDVLFIFRDDRHCLHDHLAGTAVVLADATPAPADDAAHDVMLAELAAGTGEGGVRLGAFRDRLAAYARLHARGGLTADAFAARKRDAIRDVERNGVAGDAAAFVAALPALHAAGLLTDEEVARLRAAAW